MNAAVSSSAGPRVPLVNQSNKLSTPIRPAHSLSCLSQSSALWEIHSLHLQRHCLPPDKSCYMRCEPMPGQASPWGTGKGALRCKCTYSHRGWVQGVSLPPSSRHHRQHPPPPHSPPSGHLGLWGYFVAPHLFSSCDQVRVVERAGRVGSQA